ncbi:MAG: sigma-70 family RNA polymerase sigma factor [Chitinophagaceae bacterium]|nr:MAG: sigma-70 family RNA polymerase sigma factor [Chitinophagaceae bacterium]
MNEQNVVPAGYVSDEELVQRVCAGEMVLFELLIRRYNGLLYKVARSYGFGHEDAEDLMQETHLAAYTNLKGFRRAASYRTWLTRIHLNRCYHKQRKEEQRTPVPEATTEPVGDAALDVTRRELGRVIEESLQALPLCYRSVFVLREVEGFSVAEVADLLGITPVNVKVRSNRARALLQKGLEQRYSKADLYAFHLKYCDKIVHYVIERIHSYPNDAGEAIRQQ